MILNDKDLNDLQREIDHILDSGANSIRLLNMFESFLKNREYGIDWVAIKDEMPPLHKNVLLYDAEDDNFKDEFVHEDDLKYGKYPKNYTHWAFIKTPDGDATKRYFIIRRYNSGTSSDTTDILGLTMNEEYAKSKQSVFCDYEEVKIER